MSHLMPVIAVEMTRGPTATLTGEEQLICFSTTTTLSHFSTTTAFMLDTLTLVQCFYYQWMFMVVS